MNDTNNAQGAIKRCDAAQVKVGDRLSRIQYYDVVQIEEDGQLVVQNEHGFKFRVTANIVENEMYSASQYSREEKLSRTELVERLENAGDTIFTVVFDKKATDKGVADKLKDLDPAAIATDRDRRRLARELLHGSERVLVGYLRSTEPKLGRSMVVDLAVESGKHNLRLVDHRTVKALIYKNTRYYCD